MKAIIFITSLLLISCIREEAPEPQKEKVYGPLPAVNVNYAYSVKAYLKDAVTINPEPASKVVLNYFPSGSFNPSGWYQWGKYTAASPVTVQVKYHLYLSNPSAGFKYFLRKNGATIDENNLTDTKNFSGLRVLQATNVKLNAGDFIEAYIGYSSGHTTIHPVIGSDSSYVLIQAY